MHLIILLANNIHEKLLNSDWLRKDCNSPHYFLTYLDKTIEKMVSDDKDIYIMGDFNIDLIKCESSQISQDYLISLRSSYLAGRMGDWLAVWVILEIF